MKGSQRCFNLISYIICRSVHSLRSNLDGVFSVRSGDNVGAATKNNYLYSK